MSHGHDHDLVAPVSRRARTVLYGVLAVVGLVTIVGLFGLWPASHTSTVPPQFAPFANGSAKVVTGTVTVVRAEPCPSDSNSRCATVDVKLDHPDPAGDIAQISVGGPAGAPKVAVGEALRVVRTTDPQSGRASYSFDDYSRGTPLWVLAAVFATVTVLIGRWKGLAALGGLAVAYAVLVLFLLPAVLAGESTVLVGLVASSAILFPVFFLAHGATPTSATALIGTLTALGLSAGLSWAVVGAAHLTGLSSEETVAVQVATRSVSVSGLLICGFLIGALGVLNDVTVTQASAVAALHRAQPDQSRRRLHREAMRIGRDHIASTVYTLILAYAGSALPVLLLFSLSQQPILQVVTGDEVAVELARGLVGAIALVIAVPLTTFLAAYMIGPAGADRTRSHRRS